MWIQHDRIVRVLLFPALLTLILFIGPGSEASDSEPTNAADASRQLDIRRPRIMRIDEVAAGKPQATFRPARSADPTKGHGEVPLGPGGGGGEEPGIVLPLHSIGLVEINYPNGSHKFGTGFFVNTTQFVTAGHVVLPLELLDHLDDKTVQAKYWGDRPGFTIDQLLARTTVKIYPGKHGAGNVAALTAARFAVEPKWSHPPPPPRDPRYDYAVGSLNHAYNGGTIDLVATHWPASPTGYGYSGIIIGYPEAQGTAPLQVATQQGAVVKPPGETGLFRYSELQFPTTDGMSGSPIMIQPGVSAYGVHTDTAPHDPNYPNLDRNGVEVTDELVQFVKNHP